ncbi:Nem1-Spo7 phosphatase catalytic subunit [Martiniozyma asiatica (nom. inval.)]|nr:Nem1-Spo7 phosphatase catalytic subunit [Martiniozyma asiatica]
MSRHPHPTIPEEEVFEVDNSVNDSSFKSPTASPATQRRGTSSTTIANSNFNSNANSSSSPGPRKMKFIFPKLLFQFNLFNPPPVAKKTLVLDLDETLIHSLSRHNSSMLGKLKGISIEINAASTGNVPTLYHIYKRPHVDEFLSIVRHWFNLVCFTASIREYADPVIDYLEEELLIRDKQDKRAGNSMAMAMAMSPQGNVFSQRHYRNSCIFIEGKGYVKDLSLLHTDYSKLIIIDNSPVSYSHHKNNGLMIEGWINDPDDDELLHLLPLLNSLRFVSDVRAVLSLKSGQYAFK